MLRSVALIFWAGLLFLFTCTESLEQFIQQGAVAFSWSSQPNVHEFLYPLPSVPDATFISRKVGHAFSFFILSILCFFVFLSKKKMLVISLLYAVLTEVLQLFFRRGGRLFDIGFDGAGIAVALMVVTFLGLTNEKSLTRDNGQT
jgi:VanZ family protein